MAANGVEAMAGKKRSVSTTRGVKRPAIPGSAKFGDAPAAETNPSDAFARALFRPLRSMSSTRAAYYN